MVTKDGYYGNRGGCLLLWEQTVLLLPMVTEAIHGDMVTECGCYGNQGWLLG